MVAVYWDKLHDKRLCSLLFLSTTIRPLQLMIAWRHWITLGNSVRLIRFHFRKNGNWINALSIDWLNRKMTHSAIGSTGLKGNFSIDCEIKFAKCSFVDWLDQEQMANDVMFHLNVIKRPAKTELNFIVKLLPLDTLMPNLWALSWIQRRRAANLSRVSNLSLWLK